MLGLRLVGLVRRSKHPVWASKVLFFYDDDSLLSCQYNYKTTTNPGDELEPSPEPRVLPSRSWNCSFFWATSWSWWISSGISLAPAVKIIGLNGLKAGALFEVRTLASGCWRIRVLVQYDMLLKCSVNFVKFNDFSSDCSWTQIKSSAESSRRNNWESKNKRGLTVWGLVQCSVGQSTISQSLFNISISSSSCQFLQL